LGVWVGGRVWAGGLVAGVGVAGDNVLQVVGNLIGALASAEVLVPAANAAAAAAARRWAAPAAKAKTA
jgi:hypothetical protein